MSDICAALYEWLTDDGRHPDNLAILAVLLIVIGMGAAGWLD